MKTFMQPLAWIVAVFLTIATVVCSLIGVIFQWLALWSAVHARQIVIAFNMEKP